MAAVVVRGVLDTPHAPEKPLPLPPTISLHSPRERKEPLESAEDDSRLPRAASYTDLTRLVEPDDVPIKRTFSENVLSLSSEPPRRPPPEEQASGKEILRRSSTRRANGSPKANGANFDQPHHENLNDTAYNPKVAIAVER